MTNLGVYWIGLQRLPALNDAQWVNLRQFLRDYEWYGSQIQLGASADEIRSQIVEAGYLHPRSPHLHFHQATSLDGRIIIAAQLLDTDLVTVAAFKQALADEFNVDVSEIVDTTIFHTDAIQGYNARITTFSYNANNRFRMTVFGWINGMGWPTEIDSYISAKTYHHANIPSVFWGEILTEVL